MKDNEIIKALKCCGNKELAHLCSVCPKFDKDNDYCQEELHEASLDLINRQKVEVERLQKQLKEGIDLSDDVFKIVKAEAYKEFAERLLERKYLSVEWSHGGHPYVVEEDDIEDVLTELTERKEDEGK